MAEIALSSPSVSVNGEVWAIVPGTFVYTSGLGATTTKAASLGATTTAVHSVDQEEMFSTVKFDTHSFFNINQKIADIKARPPGENTISAQEKQGDKVLILNFPGQALQNDPEVQSSKDGVVSFEWAGDTMFIT